jgi:glycosyltransferase involved in cell wall biosynthesis
MKVLYSRTHFWFGLKAGGSVGHTIGVISGLANNGEVKIVGNEPPYGIENIAGKVVKPFGRGWAAEVLYNFYFAPFLAAQIKSYQPDFVYHRFNGYSFATSAVCRLLNVPLVLEFNSSTLWIVKYWQSQNNTITHRTSRILKKALLSWSEPFNLRSANLITVVSDPLKRNLISMGLPAERILVNPNAVDTDKFKTASSQVCSGLKAALGIAPGQIVVGFSSTFGEWHGIPELTDAIQEINRDRLWRNKLFFLLLGNGKLRPMAQEKLAGFANVSFAGTVEYRRIQDYLSVCDILLSPHGQPADGAEFFGSPTKLFEYMAMGKGIVASDLGQIGKILEDGKTAVLVKPGDPMDLKRGIMDLAKNPQKAARLGHTAREVAVSNHTWSRHADRLLRTINGLKIRDGRNQESRP